MQPDRRWPKWTFLFRLFSEWHVFYLGVPLSAAPQADQQLDAMEAQRSSKLANEKGHEQLDCQSCAQPESGSLGDGKDIGAAATDDHTDPGQTAPLLAPKPVDPAASSDEAMQTRKKSNALAFMYFSGMLGLQALCEALDSDATLYALLLVLFGWGALVSSGIMTLTLVLEHGVGADKGGEECADADVCAVDGERVFAEQKKAGAESVGTASSVSAARGAARLTNVLVAITSGASAILTVVSMLAFFEVIATGMRSFSSSETLQRVRPYALPAVIVCCSLVMAACMCTTAAMHALLRSESGNARQQLQNKCRRLIRAGLHAALWPAYLIISFAFVHSVALATIMLLWNAAALVQLLASWMTAGSAFGPPTWFGAGAMTIVALYSLIWKLMISMGPIWVASLVTLTGMMRVAKLGYYDLVVLWQAQQRSIVEAKGLPRMPWI